VLKPTDKVVSLTTRQLPFDVDLSNLAESFAVEAAKVWGRPCSAFVSSKKLGHGILIKVDAAATEAE
jgi:hypothetical protein